MSPAVDRAQGRGRRSREKDVDYLMVGIGSALGGMLRFGVGSAVVAFAGPGLPWGTLVVNIVGSFVLGAFVGFAGTIERIALGTPVYNLVAVGLCGGFTTFSTFSVQTLALFQDGDWAAAVGNVVFSLVCCLGAAALGMRLSGYVPA